jgi:uroporphyrinogen decarboxylase
MVALPELDVLDALECDIVQRAGGVDTFMPSGSTVFDADHMVRQIETLLPEIKDFIDVIMFAADDQGTQYGPLLPPSLFREVFVPSCRRMSDAIHREAPGVKVFLHSCGAIFELIPAIIDAGFDVLNPVQWSAGRHSYREWEETAGGKISLWGSGYVVRPSSKGYGAEE